MSIILNVVKNLKLYLLHPKTQTPRLAYIVRFLTSFGMTGREVLLYGRLLRLLYCYAPS
jgi:hypothetical protein